MNEMAYHQIRGNENLVAKLETITKSENVHHAYIFEGPLNSDKTGIAVSFAQALLCKKSPGTGCGVCRDACPYGVIYFNECSEISFSSIEVAATRLAQKRFDANGNTLSPVYLAESKANHLAEPKDAICHVDGELVSFEEFYNYRNTVEEKVDTYLLINYQNSRGKKDISLTYEEACQLLNDKQ